jgi:signal transduction histidine kinase
VRHADCNRVEIVLRTEHRRLTLQMKDNGKGFAIPLNGHGDGHGLSNLEQRAREMGGQLQISSEPGRGTAVALSVPLDHRSPRAFHDGTT